MSWIKRLVSHFPPFLTANITLGGETMVRLVTGVLKAKISALFLGPVGVGLLGVAYQVQALGATWGSLSMSSGFSHKLAQFLKNKDHVNKRSLLSTAFTIIIVLNLFLICIGLLNSKTLSKWIFGDFSSTKYLVPVLLTIPFLALIPNYFQAIFYTHQKLKTYTLARVLGAVVELILFGLLVKYWNLLGAFWALMLGAFASVFACALYASRLEPLKEFIHFGLNAKLGSQLIQSGLVMSMTGTILYLTNACIRIHIIHELGSVSNGIYQVVLTITAFYSPLLTSGVWARIFQQACAHGLEKRTINEWSDSFCVITFVAVSIQLGILIFPTGLIYLLYSKSFYAAVSILPIQLLGDYFFLLGQPSLGIILGLQKLRIYLFVWILLHLLLIVLTWWLSKVIGLKGVSVAYMLSNACLAIFGLASFIFANRNKSQVAYTLGVIILGGLFLLVQASLAMQSYSIFYRIILFIVFLVGSSTIFFVPRFRKRIFS